jgi:hypothetical protein
MAVAIPLVIGSLGAEMAAGTAVGAAAGWAIGASIGSLIEQRINGVPLPPNALTDLSVQTSAWGTGIPQIIGTQRVSGNIIWSTDKRLVGGSTGKWGGKGGGGGKSGGKKGPQEGYYVVDLALALCEGPIAGIKRIWAGGQLIFDDSNPVFVPSMNPSQPGSGSYQQMYATNGPIVSTGGSALGSWTLYHGTGLQNADPTIAANGSSNGDGGVPYQRAQFGNNTDYTYNYGAPAFGKLGTAGAYRGVAYIVFENLNLGFGGSIPPLSFEVVSANGGYEGMAPLAGPFSVDLLSEGGLDFWTGFAVVESGQYIALGTGSLANVFDGTTTAPFGGAPGLVDWTPIQNGNTIEYYTTRYNADILNKGAVEKLTSSLGGIVSSVSTLQTNFLTAADQASVYAVGGNTWWTKGDGTWYSAIGPRGSIVEVATGYPLVASGNNYPLPASTACVVIGHFLYYASVDSTANTTTLVALDGQTGAFTTASLGSGNSLAGLWTTDGSSIINVSKSASQAQTIAAITTISTAGQVISSVQTSASSSIGASVNVSYYDDSNGGALYGVGGAVLTKVRLTTGEVLGTANTYTNPSAAQVVQQGVLVYTTGANTLEWTLFSFGNNVIIPGKVTLPEALAIICERAGVSSFDTSLVPSGVYVNMTRHANSAARDLLKVLGTAYTFDMVDSAGTLRFVPKGSSQIAAAFSMADLGFAALTPTGVPSSAWMRSRVQGTDLPRSVSVKYTSALASYQPFAALYQVRYDQGKDVTVNLPLTLDDATANNLAMYLCASPHIERDALTWTTPLHFFWLEPGDLVQMPGADGEPSVYRITKMSVKDVQKTPVIEFAGVNDASYVMRAGAGMAQPMPTPVLGAGMAQQNSLPSAAPGSFINTNPVAGGLNTGQPVPTMPVANPGLAYAAYFELPSMDSTDTTPKLYLEPWSSGTVFLGASLYQSKDGGSTFTKIATQAASGVAGTVSAAMPATQAVTWDMATTVDVYLKAPYMTLAGATDMQVYAGANYAKIGDELIQYANANALKDAQGRAFYRLSRLLRGRRGTEWAMSTHAANELFLAADPSDTEDSAVQYALGDLGAPYSYKVGTVGQSVDQVIGTPYTITGVWFKPFSAVHPKLSLSSAGDWTLSFTPRARLSGYSGSGFQASLDADTQTFSADVVKSGKVVRTITGQLSSPSLTYSAAQQAADGFAAGQHGIEFVVYQVQANIGRGYPLTVTT